MFESIYAGWTREQVAEYEKNFDPTDHGHDPHPAPAAAMGTGDVHREDSLRRARQERTWSNVQEHCRALVKSMREANAKALLQKRTAELAFPESAEASGAPRNKPWKLTAPAAAAVPVPRDAAPAAPTAPLEAVAPDAAPAAPAAPVEAVAPDTAPAAPAAEKEQATFFFQPWPTLDELGFTEEMLLRLPPYDRGKWP